MPKRSFRTAARPARDVAPSYPTTDDFDGDRRSFLVKLGGALLGAGVLAACGGRPVAATPDGATPLGGEAPQPDSRVDQYVEPPLSGGAPQPPSRADMGVEWGVDGDVTQPDAAMDAHVLGGAVEQPDAKIDPNPGP